MINWLGKSYISLNIVRVSIDGFQVFMLHTCEYKQKTADREEKKRPKGGARGQGRSPDQFRWIKVTLSILEEQIPVIEIENILF